MNKAPLSEITVDSNGDIRVGNAVFRSTCGYITSKNRNDILRKVLEANGYLSPYTFLENYQAHSELVARYSKLKGFYEISRLTDGRLCIESYDFPEIANKYSASVFGSGFLARLRGVMWREWLVPFESCLNDLGVIRYGFSGFAGNSPNHTYMLRKSAPLVNELIDDGLLHIAPYVMLFRRSPKELKALFGKGLWRQLCVNSKSRNKLILSSVLTVFDGYSDLFYRPQASGRNVFADGCRIAGLLDDIADGAHDLRLVEIICELNKIPSSYLSYMDSIHVPARPQDEIATGTKGGDAFLFAMHQWVWPIAKSEGSLCCRSNGRYTRLLPSKRVRALVDLFSDTYEMSVKLNNDFNPKWSLKRMQETHDLYAKELTAMEYSKGTYAHCADIPGEFAFDLGSGRAVATIVSSPFEVAMLGKSHFNCLASFAEKLCAPNMLLFCVKYNGKESACLLVKRADKWIVSQHYHPRNQSVDDDFVEIGKLLLSAVDEYSEILDSSTNEQIVGFHRSEQAGFEGRAIWGAETLWRVDQIPF